MTPQDRRAARRRGEEAEELAVHFLAGRGLSIVARNYRTRLGEVDIVRKVGLTPVFFARTVVGPRMPSLVYMLVHENMAGREKSWDGFRTSPDWKRVAATPGYADAEIVSNITTVFLRPAAYSQI